MKKIKALALVGTLAGGIYFGIGTASVNAAVVSDDVGVNAIPTQIGMTPSYVNKQATSHRETFKLSFSGGTGTYHWSFSYDDGTPPRSDTTNYYYQNVEHTYSLGRSQSKNTWHPYASVVSTNSDSVSGTVRLYR